MANTTNTVSTAAKDILARILAGENLTIEHNAKAHTAMFDTKSRILTLPVWDNMTDSMYDMLIGHEVGHALYTPWTERDEAANGIAAAIDIGGKGNADIAMDYLNVVEDARIERMVQDKFPGLRRDFFSAYKELVDRDFFGLKGTDINTLPLLDRLNIHFKLGTQSPQNLIFTPAEQVFVDRIAAAKSFDEVTVIASDLYSYCGNARNDEEREQYMTKVKAKAQAGVGNETPEGDASGSGDGADADDQGANGIDGDNNDNGDDAGDSPSDSTGAGKMYQTPARSKTQNAFNDNMRKHQDATKTRSVGYGVLDTPKIENIVWDYKNVAADIAAHAVAFDAKQQPYASNQIKSSEKAYRDLMNAFMVEAAPIVNNMVKQFEMRKAADRAKRTSVARSGVIDTVRMMSYKFSEDIFRRNAIVADGKSHGMVMFIDWSSSMSGYLMDTVKQLTLLFMFCRKVNIPFEVYAFTSCPVNPKLGKCDPVYPNSRVYSKSEFWTKNTLGNAVSASFSPFMLLNFMSSRMSTNEYKQGIDNLFRVAYAAASYDNNLVPHNYHLGSTPLDEAIVAAMEIVPAFREANKLQIVNTVFLTDGQSSGNSLPYGSTYYKTKAYITDPATRKTYEVTDSDSGSITSTLLRIFRDRTKTNAIGFYITYGKSLPITHPWQVNDVRDDKAFSDASASWRDNGFAVALPNAGGYTEWYIVCSTDLKVDASNDALSRVVNGGGSVASVTKALLKDAKAKNKSKLIVGRFINLIAK